MSKDNGHTFSLFLKFRERHNLDEKIKISVNFSLFCVIIIILLEKEYKGDMGASIAHCFNKEQEKNDLAII